MVVENGDTCRKWCDESKSARNLSTKETKRV